MNLTWISQEYLYFYWWSRLPAEQQSNAFLLQVFTKKKLA